MKVANFQYFDDQGWVGVPDCSVYDSQSTLVMAFCAPMYEKNPKPLEELQKWFPNSVIIGCSTSGEISGMDISDLSISVAVLKLEVGKVRVADKTISSPLESEAVGRHLAAELAGDQLKGIIVLSEGLTVNGSSLVSGFNSVIDSTKTVLSGGLAGDGNYFQRTWVMSGGKIQSGLVVAAGLYGAELDLSCSSRGGWDIFGPERTITKSEGSVVYEIDGQPALELYKKYLGDRAKDLPASGLLFPLQIWKESENLEERKLTRTLLGVSEEDQSLTFAGSIPQGSRTHLLRANFDRVIDAASDAADQAKIKSEGEQFKSEPVCALAVSCVGRRLVLGERTDEETEAVCNALGENAHVVGFYSYGELGGFDRGAPCELQNQTMTVLTISEKMTQVAKKAS